MAAKMTYSEAYALVSSLRKGDDVVYADTPEGPKIAQVQREIFHQDGTGAATSYGVKIGFGIGRWNTFIGIDAVMNGTTLRKAD